MSKSTLLTGRWRVQQSIYSRLAGYEDVNDAERLLCPFFVAPASVPVLLSES
ncbi:MAG: hypothetical protein WA005_15010 [Candidatus Binataceae bacterium]